MSLEKDFSAILATAPIEGNDSEIFPQHFPALADKLQVSLDNDIALYAFAWKIKAKSPLKISKSEFVDGLKGLRCTSIAAAAKIMGSIRAEIVPEENWRSFYDFCFEWCRETSSHRFLTLETAVALWPLLFKDRSFPHLQSFLEYLNAKNVKNVPRDVWKQMYHFAKADLNNWDENGSWPSVMDDFVHSRKK